MYSLALLNQFTRNLDRSLQLLRKLLPLVKVNRNLRKIAVYVVNKDINQMIAFYVLKMQTRNPVIKLQTRHFWLLKILQVPVIIATNLDTLRHNASRIAIKQPKKFKR
jgi:hypothetical protein